MHGIKIISLSIIIFLCFSCKGKVEPSKIGFMGYSFELPGKVRVLKKSLNLKYGYYDGFFNRNVDHSISTQIENHSLFMGDDNIDEESYFDDNIVGITFSLDSKLFNKEKIKLQKIHKAKFKYKKAKSNWFTEKYWILNTDDKLQIVLIEKLKYSDTIMTVSFYKGINADEIENYITHNSN